MHRGQHRLRRRVGLSRQWAIIGNSLRSKYLWGTPAIEPAQAVFHHPPNCFSAAAENAPGESSRTWYTPAYDVADRILARSDPARPCRPARCKERNSHPGEVPLRRADDSRYPEYALPETSAHAQASACVRACSVAWVGDDRSSAGCRRGQLYGREGRPRRR
jgi:hypothetical protein